MTDYQGLTIKFEGDATDLLNTLRAIDGKATSTQSGLKRISEAMKLNPLDTRLYTERSRMLTKEIGYQEKALSRVKGEYRDVSGLQREMQAQLDAMDPSDAGYDQLAADIEYCNEWMKDLDGEMAVQESKLGGLRRAHRDAAMAAELHSTKLGQFALGARKFADDVDLMSDKLMALGTKLTTVSAVLALGFGRNVIRNTEEYGNAISQVGGYLNITGQSLEEMSDLALYWGKETQFSATEAAEAMSELAKGGMTQAQIKGGVLATTIQLAAASGISMADAATVAVNAIKVFGLTADDSAVVADALAGAANKSTAEIGDLASAFRYVSGWAGLADYSVNDVSGALGLLADHGLQAEMAGTGLRNFMQRLGAPTGKAKELLDKYGVTVYDTSGKMKSLTDLVDELNDAFGDLDDETRNETLNTIFGARALPAAIALMSAGSDELERYIGATKRVGYAGEMAQARMGDLGWALEYLRGEAETAAVNLGNALTPMIIGVANAMEDLLSTFNNMSKADRKKVADILLAIVATGPGILATSVALKGFAAATRGLSTLTMFASFLKTAKATAPAAETAIETLGQAIHATTEGAISAGKATSLLSSGISLLGGTIAVAGLAAFGALIYDGYTKTKRLNSIVRRTNDIMDKAAPSTDKFAESVYDVGDSAKGTAESVNNLLGEVSNLYDRIDESFTEVETSASRLNKADEIIQNLGGRTDLSPEDVQELAGALAYINEVLGTNYALHSDTSGVIYDENDAVVTLTGSIHNLIEAQKQQMKAEALSNLLTDAYEEQAKAHDELSAAEENYWDIVRRRQAGEHSMETSDFALDQAKANWDDAQVAADAADAAVQKLEGDYDDAAEAAMRAAEKSQNALAENVGSIEGLSAALDEHGLNVSDFVGLTNDAFNQMVADSGGDIDVLIAKLQEWKDQQPANVDLEANGEQAESEIGDVKSAADETSGTYQIDFDVDSSKAIVDANNAYDDIWNTGLEIEPPPIEVPVRATIDSTFLDDVLNGIDRELDLWVNVDTTEAQAEIDTFYQDNVTTPGDIEFVVDADTDEADQNLQGVIDRSKEVDEADPTVTASADTVTAQSNINALSASARSLERPYYMHFYLVKHGSAPTHERDGGINYYAHADGYITNHRIYSGDHLIGEAGIEAVLPLNNRAATQPLTDTIASGVASRLSGGTQYNLYINDARVNDDPAIRSAFIDLMGAVNRKGMQTNAAR